MGVLASHLAACTTACVSYAIQSGPALRCLGLLSTADVHVLHRGPWARASGLDLQFALRAPSKCKHVLVQAITKLAVQQMF